MHKHHFFKIRSVVVLLFAIIALQTMNVTSAFASRSKDPAVVFMKKVSKELMSAVRSGKKRNLERVIRRYADLAAIGQYSLGDYKRKLSRRYHSTYYRGVAKFMARYFMDQSKKYNVVGAKVESPSFVENGETIVDTQVRLRDGTVYEVQWRLTSYRRSYKIRDIRVLGFWLVPYQRDLFNNFVDEQGGNVNALVIALNHN